MEPGSGEAGLYGLDPAAFTEARDALAKQLRAGGDRQEADRVKKLRRPSITAWALNQAARRQPDLVAAALDAGSALRAATRQAIGGDASALREARLHERRAVNQAVSAAADILEAAGHPASDAARMRMAETVRAAFVDDDVAGRLRRGTLDTDRRAAGFDLEGGAAAPAEPAAEPDRPPESEPPDGEPPDELGHRRAQKHAAALAAEADDRERRAGRLREEAARADRNATEARLVSEQAARRAAEAHQAAEDAERRATDAARRAADAREATEAAERAAADARQAAAESEAAGAGGLRSSESSESSES